MKFDITKNTHYTVLKLNERKLDISISPELKGEFILLCRPSLKTLIVDLSGVEFCDSSGLSALLIAERKMRENGNSLRLIGVHKKVLALMKISQLDRVFQIFDTLAKASHS
jgi:anti-sigma B factor antagonist